MKSVYGLLKPLYKRIVPECIQQLTWSDQYPFWRVIGPIKRLMQRHAAHDEIYDRYYFEETVDPPARKAAAAMAETVIDLLAPDSVIDVGCGTAALLAELKARGVNVYGLDNADAALEIARRRGVSVEKMDLETDLVFDREANVAISLEVAEHLPECVADKFVDFLCRIAPVILMTAATPGGCGTDHVNEQPHPYWVAKFEARGMRFDESLSSTFRQHWRQAGGFYWPNVLVFQRYMAGRDR